MNKLEAPDGYTWKKVSDIEIGDLVHSWGDDLMVKDTHLKRPEIVLDVQDGKELKSWIYKLDDELLVKL